MAVLTDLIQGTAERLAGKMPKRVNVRELSRATTQVLTTLRDEGTSALITYRGVPRFIIMPIDSDHVSELILAGAPGIFTQAVSEGEQALKELKVQAPH